MLIARTDISVPTVSPAHKNGQLCGPSEDKCLQEFKTTSLKHKDQALPAFRRQDLLTCH